MNDPDREGGGGCMIVTISIVGFIVLLGILGPIVSND